MTPSNMTGKMLKEWRLKLGWSQDWAAKTIGVCVASYRSYENEKRSDKADKIKIPLLVAWACSAITGGLKPTGGRGPEK